MAKEKKGAKRPRTGEARFAAYLDEIAAVLGRANRAAAARAYCTGLLLPGERKSMEPMAARIAPDRVQAAHQSLHHVVAQAEWDDAADLPAIARIYGHWVLHGLASFELVPPGAEEMARRRAAILAGGFPHLVAEDEAGRVLGYAYAGPFRTRPAYRFTCEDSVYVAPEAAGRGIGRALLPALLARCEAAGLRRMVAVIGDSGNAASIALHAACGFRHAGLIPATGWKHGRRVDTVLMERPLGPGDASLPEERPG